MHHQPLTLTLLEHAKHSPSDLNQDGLHGVVSLPLTDVRQLAQIHLSVPRIHTGGVDPAHERHLWWYVRVLVATTNLEAVDAVFVDRVRGSENCAVPVGHADVVALVQTVRAGFCRTRLEVLPAG